MTSWTHTLPEGGTITIAVYQRDFPGDLPAYDAEVVRQMALYPPD